MTHPSLASNRDYAFFYDGLERRELLIQRCRQCRTLRTPPSPGCASCGSTEWEARASEGKGRLFSYTVHHHPPIPGFQTPHGVGVVELDEGPRMIGAMDGIPIEAIAIGMPLQVEFCRRGEVDSYRFRIPTPDEEA